MSGENDATNEKEDFRVRMFGRTHAFTNANNTTTLSLTARISTNALWTLSYSNSQPNLSTSPYVLTVDSEQVSPTPTTLPLPTQPQTRTLNFQAQWACLRSWFLSKDSASSKTRRRSENLVVQSTNGIWSSAHRIELGERDGHFVGGAD